MPGRTNLVESWPVSKRCSPPASIRLAWPRAATPALEKTCLGLAAEDKAGRRWAREHGYGGYTSYASLNDLTRRASVIAELEADIARHVAHFARDADFDLGGRKLRLDSLWVNVMEKGAIHGPHIHPHAAVSGTYYVTVPGRLAPSASRIRAWPC